MTRALAELGDQIALTDPPQHVLASLLDDLSTARAELDEQRRPWWQRGPDFEESYRVLSPFRGEHNPRSVGLVLSRVDDEASSSGDRPAMPRLRGEITIGETLAGPPGCVHGGILAGIFDEALGAVASCVNGPGMTMTATLAVRFHQPTPLLTPLEIHAEVLHASSRRLKTLVTCTVDEVITASAEGLFVRRNTSFAKGSA